MSEEPRVVGPGFHARVYAVVRRVPRGKVATYGQIATLLGVCTLSACGVPEETDPAGTTGGTDAGSSSSSAQATSGTEESATTQDSAVPDVGSSDPGGQGPPLTPPPSCVPGQVGHAARGSTQTDLGTASPGPSIRRAVVGWFDADQWRDLGVEQGGAFIILRGKPDGEVSTFEESAPPFPNGITDVDNVDPLFAADLTGDGRHELVRQKKMALTDADGGIVEVVELPLSPSVFHDFDTDAVLDMFAVGYGTSSVIFGEADGLFGPPIEGELEISSDEHVFFDFDADGVLDFVAIDNDGGPFVAAPAQMQLYLGSGDGSFAAATGLIELDVARYSGTAADLDCDGRPELMLGDAATGITVWRYEADELAQVDAIATPSPDTLALADFNGDGVVDLAVRDRIVDLEEFTISVLPGVGDGTFHPRVQLSSNLHNLLLGSVDLDGDNRFSVIVGDQRALRLYDIE